MATSTEGIRFQANFKTPGGTLVNLYAPDAQEFDEQLDAAPEFIAKIVAIESSLTQASRVANVVPVAPPAQQPAQPAANQGWGNAPAAAPQGGGHTCSHGPMRLVPAGISKSNGKPYKAFYACPADRNDPSKCKSISVG